MKNMSRIFIALTLLVPLVTTAQDTLSEPEFINTVAFISKRNTHTALEQQSRQTKNTTSATTYIVGVGKVKSINFVEGEKSDVRIVKSDTLKFIVSIKDHNENPAQIITIGRMKQNIKKHIRFIDMADAGGYKGLEQGETNKVNFLAVKYGAQSYVVSVVGLDPGEYVITLRDALATWQMFGVD